MPIAEGDYTVEDTIGVLANEDGSEDVNIDAEMGSSYRKAIQTSYPRKAVNNRERLLIHYSP